ncbi:MAG TPA: hypothetical protein DER68_00420 [Ruminococcaceae bacterium]|nr:hypothetical protein [Oscillospiraceae bacterium]
MRRVYRHRETISAPFSRLCIIDNITNTARKLSHMVGILWKINTLEGDFKILFDKTAYLCYNVGEYYRRKSAGKEYFYER